MANQRCTGKQNIHFYLQMLDNSNTAQGNQVIKITHSGVIKTDVLKWITAVKCGWQFDCSCFAVWLKYQDYANVMIKVEHIDLV